VSEIVDVSPELYFEIQDFLFREANLLDEGRFEEWLGLLTEDVRYIMPVRRNIEVAGNVPVKPADNATFSLFDDDKPSLALRIRRVETGYAHAEVPRSTVQRVVSNIRIEPGASTGEVVAHSNFIAYQERRGRHAATFFGKRQDRLRREGGTWKIARRRIELAQTILPSTISILF
jgi:3-phenylpropionate/cinnamic acid dioxygenase small subunit